jgi:integrase
MPSSSTRRPGRQSSFEYAATRASRWACTGFTPGGTAASRGRGSRRKESSRASGCKARHTAGQRVLDATGNLKAVQKLLGHASIQTTGNIYTDWDVDQPAQTLEQIDDD